MNQAGVSEKAMRILIVDDEPLARAALAHVLSSREDIAHFDAAGDAIEAFEKIESGSFDVLLLDINMPELSGLELLDRLKRSQRTVPSIVFVTAHEEYALNAFTRHAVDYVLKPFSSERINEALDVAFRRTTAERLAKIADMLPQLRDFPVPQSSRIAIKADGRILFIEPSDVIAVHAEGNYVLLQREAGSHLLRESISVLADKLRPYGFIRIHRSVLVNRAFVKEIRPWATGEYGLLLKSGKEYTVTRTYKKNLKEIAGSWIGTDGFAT
jgi:two-component system, LytTR family, response regulator